ncbi:MAG: radical SAM protein [Burkholderiales bacterium]
MKPFRSPERTWIDMSLTRCLSGDEIGAHRPAPAPAHGTSPLEKARRIAAESGHSGPHQQLGSRWPTGCVALEITQRCNLDCTLCYLSESSEAVRDIPLEEIFRRIEMIRRHYGANTDVQVTGGEPTLRDRVELREIVRRVRASGMRPTLMTNGLRATRELLAELAASGLEDVAFHVDTTQQRRGYRSESDLNAIRRKYIDAARGLRISVIFNTTVHDGNFEEIPEVVRFFRAHAGAVRTASFQLQAETGRGVQGKRSSVITPESVAAQVERGAGTPINFAASLVGHPGCNRYGLCLEAGGRLHDAFDDPRFVARIQAATAGLVLHRNDLARTARGILHWLSGHPEHLGAILKWTLKKAWRMKRDLLASRGRVRTLSFLLHNFMDARTLERDRIDACVFMTMTRDGPVSMCLHNARRDSFILQPMRFHGAVGRRFWQPLTGNFTQSERLPGAAPETSPKRLKGRIRQAVLHARAASAAGVRPEC